MTRILLSASLVVASVVSAQACSKHGGQAMSCAEGTVWNSETGACEPRTTS